MNGNDGWVKIYRSLIENPKFTRSSRLALWVYILLSVNHTQKKTFFNGKEITLNPGQGLFSTPDLARKLCLSVSVIRRSLDWFESEQQIEQQKTSHGTVITVVNWDKYQKSEQPNEQQVNNQRTTSEQPVNNLPIIKECKNEINKEIYKENDDFSEVAKAFEANFPCALNSFNASQLNDAINEFGKEAVLFGIRTARAKNVSKVSYIRTVAMNESRRRENGNNSNGSADAEFVLPFRQTL